jgi:hypothetical protein
MLSLENVPVEHFQRVNTLKLISLLKATPHKEHLTILHVICLHIFRHLAPFLLGIRKYSCVVIAQADKKSDCASDAQSLCGVALTLPDAQKDIFVHHAQKYPHCFIYIFKKFFAIQKILANVTKIVYNINVS